MFPAFFRAYLLYPNAYLPDFSDSFKRNLLTLRVSPVKTGEGKVVSYHPGCDINLLTIRYVLDNLDKKGSEDIPDNLFLGDI